MLRVPRTINVKEDQFQPWRKVLYCQKLEVSRHQLQPISEQPLSIGDFEFLHIAFPQCGQTFRASQTIR